MLVKEGTIMQHFPTLSTQNYGRIKQTTPVFSPVVAIVRIVLLHKVTELVQ